MKVIVSSVSARPNFVKLAAVHHVLAARPNDFTHIIVHTGQHYDPLLSDIFFEQLKIPEPTLNLGIRREPGGDRNELIYATRDEMLLQLSENDIHPDVFLVYGDVNGAVGAALAAKELNVALAHVEAGLRSGDMNMPEELNRIEIDGMADILFTSEESGKKNLEDEEEKSEVRGKIYNVGNTMIDTLRAMIPVIEKEELPKSLPKRFGILTLHRPSNVDEPETLLHLLRFLEEVSKVCPLLFPVHARTIGQLRKLIDSSKTLHIVNPQEQDFCNGINVIPPLGYVPFLHLLKNSAFILTDSGGIQEEATFLKKRCFTLRRNTERPSTIDSGSNVLIDPSKPEDRQKVLDYAKNPKLIDVKIPELWDGKAGERIVDVLTKML